MNQPRRLVFDTNVLVSALLRTGSVPHCALLRARVDGTLLASDETVGELRAVLMRDKFDSIVRRALREAIIDEYARLCMNIKISSPVRVCRDPRDDKFLKVAVHGQAKVIITGDEDLLTLHPFRGIAILNPRDYLERG